MPDSINHDSLAVEYDRQAGIITVKKFHIPVVIVQDHPDPAYGDTCVSVTVCPAQARTTLPYARWQCRSYFGIENTSEFTAIVDVMDALEYHEAEAQTARLRALLDRASTGDLLEFWYGPQS